MAAITGWKFTTSSGLTFDEHTNYPEDLVEKREIMKLPTNTLSLAKLAIHSDDLKGAQFHFQGCSIEIPDGSILTFNPFLRAGSSGGGQSDGQYFYYLDSIEYPLKKKMRL